MEIRITVWCFERSMSNSIDNTIAAAAAAATTTTTTATTLYLKKAGQLATEPKYSTQI